MRKLLPLVIFFIGLQSKAEVPGFHTISGTVLDSLTGKGLDYVIVALKDNENTKVVASAFTEADGTFTLNQLKPGEYWLNIAYVGYVSHRQKISLSKNLKLDPIKLSQSTTQLNQVEIVAERNLIQKEAGKTTYNVSKSSINVGGTLEDVVRNLPNLTVDQKGNISISGNKSVSVWLDGKPSTMAEVDLAAFLKSIPASAIENIEVITNPSSKYDAAGSGGIIHVHLKKDKRDGLNGNVSAGYGFLFRDNLSGSVNYRTGKWNFFGSYGFQRDYDPHRYDEDRTVKTADTTYYYSMRNTGTGKSYGNTGKIGVDFIPSNATTLSYTFNVNQRTASATGTTNGQSYNSLKEPDLTFKTLNRDENPSLTISNDITVRSDLDTNGKSINIGLTHTWVSNQSNSGLQTRAFDHAANELTAIGLDRKTPSKSDIHNVIFQFDFSMPTSFGSKLETGLKNETTLNRNQYEVFDFKNGSYVREEQLSNNFQYLENISAYYVMLSGPIKNWLEYSAGLRMEHTFINSNTSNVNRNYLSLFPNVGLTAHPSEEQSVGVAYSRRVQRPDFSQINNVIFYSDPYTSWQGNPNLRPAFSDIVSFNYSIMKKKWMISLDAEGIISKDMFSEGTKLDAEGITRSGVYNGSDAIFANVSLYTKYDPTKWWSIQMSNAYNYQNYSAKSGINNGKKVGHQYSLWLNTTFKFWKTASLEIGGWMNTGGVFAQGRGFPAGMLNVGLKKSFLKNKLSVTVSGKNLLNTMNFRWTVENDPLNTTGRWQVLNRTVFVTLSYTFGSSKKYERKENEGNSRLSGGGKR